MKMEGILLGWMDGWILSWIVQYELDVVWIDYTNWILLGEIVRTGYCLYGLYELGIV